MGIQQKARVEAHRTKLHTALTKSTGDMFPVNLKWMVDLFFYKHISSLTTHLKRHFREDVDYTRRPDGRRSWSYHITLSCFVKICKYARHAKRQAVSKQWMRLLSKSGTPASPHRHSKGSDVGMGGREMVVEYGNDLDDLEECVPSAIDSGDEAGYHSEEECEESEDASPSPDETDSDESPESMEVGSRIPEHLYTSLMAQSPTIAIPFLSDWSYLRLVPLPLPVSLTPYPTQPTPSRIYNQQQHLQHHHQQQQFSQQQAMLQRLQAYKSANNYYVSNNGSYYVSNNNNNQAKILLRPAGSIPTTHLRHHNVIRRNSVGESEDNCCDGLDNSFDTNVFLSLDDE